MAYLARFFGLGTALVILSGCVLDKPESARAFVDRWTWPGEETYFTSDRGCSVAVYRLQSPGLRTGTTRVYDLRQGVAMLRAGRAVAFADPRLSPDAVASAVMSVHLHTGIGLVSSVTGPRACMSDAVARGIHRLLMTPDVITVYDPVENALLLLDTGGGHVVFLRGAV